MTTWWPPRDLLQQMMADSGTVELDPAGRWIVTTVPASWGLRRIETLLTDWNATAGVEWSFLNIYDEQGHPLDWWQ